MNSFTIAETSESVSLHSNTDDQNNVANGVPSETTIRNKGGRPPLQSLPRDAADTRTMTNEKRDRRSEFVTGSCLAPMSAFVG
jgi:hypothetical protein